ncbi:GAF domain-containing protein [Sphingomonas sp. PAMC 26605]|uniref:GAF domain-containing protein n=1 Tax=Sphingomonas sp. PAMC 26605 TaxID=1112214 RepID=UPI00026CD7DA|nr:GAF domain-containing protein [Sphingomonas sp. PAMC 26605]
MDALEALQKYDVLDTGPEQGFEDIVALAAQICRAPTSLVSLLDTDRQWFKARVGFDPEQTSLDQSVCRHVVEAAKTVVITDLTADPRTRDNTLVTGGPRIRFYAGAPLATRFGVIGALCIIDTIPRPDGLTADEQQALERLARQVVALLEMRKDAAELRRALSERDASEAAERVTDRRWRDLYRNMEQGFIYARVLRDEDGQIFDWRYEEVNNAWGELVGIDPDDARGKTIRELIPGIENEWVMELAAVVDTHKPVHFTRQVGVFNRWYDGAAQWIGNDDFTVIFHEVTARVEEVRRRDALLALGDVLRNAGEITDVIAEASCIVGEAVEASRATFGEMDHNRQRIRVASGWALPNMPSIEGDYRFDDYGQMRPYLIRGEIFVVNDVLTDDRTANEASSWAELQARAVINVPVREHGRTTAVLIVHRDTPHSWNAGELSFLRNAADRLEIAIARKRDEERQDVVNGEIAHRLKNALAMAQAISNQTLRGDASPKGLEAFGHRLQALGMAHDALTADRWKGATLGDMLANVLDVAGIRDRCVLSGPKVEMGARAALSTSLLTHELATNALKYGALSVEGGTVDIAWGLAGEADAVQLALDWTERGGPPASPPTRKGFGSRLIRLGLIGTGGSDVRYGQTGFAASFRALLAQVEQT